MIWGSSNYIHVAYLGSLEDEVEGKEEKVSALGKLDIGHW